jgi:hypothetical protein
MANYVFNVQFEIPFRLKLVGSETEDASAA